MRQPDPQQVDWGTIHARPGQYACPVHGLVQPAARVVPACPDCGRAAHVAVAGPGRTVVWREPAPEECAGTDRHPLGPGQVSLGTTACSCSPTGIHRTWTCQVCGNVQEWPPHDPAGVAPYYGPGSR